MAGAAAEAPVAGTRSLAVSGGSSGEGRRRAGETEAERAERKRLKKAEKEARKAVRRCPEALLEPRPRSGECVLQYNLMLG